MKKKLSQNVKEVREACFDSKKEKLIKIHKTTFRCSKWRYEFYVDSYGEGHYKKVESWVQDFVLPYMTEKSINYNSCNSDEISTRCESYLGEDVPHELITYILASKGIIGENRRATYQYPSILYYPLSNDFKKPNGGMMNA